MQKSYSSCLSRGSESDSEANVLKQSKEGERGGDRVRESEKSQIMQFMETTFVVPLMKRE